MPPLVLDWASFGATRPHTAASPRWRRRTATIFLAASGKSLTWSPRLPLRRIGSHRGTDRSDGQGKSILGLDRIVGALANLGPQVSDQTVGDVLRRHGIPRAPDRRRTTTRAEFVRAHLAVLVGTDFFTVEVLTLRGLVTYYVLFFIHLESRKVESRDHNAPDRAVDEANGSERHHGRKRRP
jgi:hypothetical protein